MHIIVDAQALLRREDGIGRYCKELFTELIEQTDHTYELVGFRDQQNTPRLIPESDRVQYTFLPLPRRLYAFIFKHFASVSIDRWLARPADLAIYPNFVDTPFVAGAPRFVIIHDVAYIDRPKTLSKRNLNYLEKHAPKALRRAERVFAISKFSARRLSELYRLSVEDIGVLSPAINQANFKKPNNNVLKKYDLNRGYILNVGTIEPRKNHNMLIEAYMQLPKQLRSKHQLVLAGRPGWRTESLVQRIEGLQQAGEDIVITGFFDDDDLASLYSHAGVFVQASTYEGFGIPPLEAMAYKTPVVSSDASALAEAVGDAAVIIDPNDSQSIADGLQTVLTDSRLQAELIEKGLEQIKHFSWLKSAQQLASAIKQMESK